MELSLIFGPVGSYFMYYWRVIFLLTNLISPLYIVESAEFSCPSWFPVGAKSLIRRILDPNPETRIRIPEIKDDEWFKRGYTPARLIDYEDVNLDDVNAVFDDAEDEKCDDEQQYKNESAGPLILNAFDLIILSQGLNLSSLFTKGPDAVKHQTRFVSHKPAKVVLTSMEVVAQSMGFKTHIRNYKMRVEGLAANKAGHLCIILEIFEVAPSIFMVDIQKSSGDVNEYLKFYKNFCANLEDIIWRPAGDSRQSRMAMAKAKSRRR